MWSRIVFFAFPFVVLGFWDCFRLGAAGFRV